MDEKQAAEQKIKPAETTQEGTAPEQNMQQSVRESESRIRAPGRRLSRRQFLLVSAVAGGIAGTGLLISLRASGAWHQGGSGATATSVPLTSFEPNIWIRIDADNTTSIWIGKSEMGQGISTALAMIAAEELDADWATVKVQQAPADTQYGEQKTDGSTSVSDSFYTMRRAGATARAFLVAVAAKAWQVNPTTCRTEKGQVIHASDSKRLSYGELIGVASRLKLNPATLTLPWTNLKDPAKWSLIGTRVQRIDAPQKVNGSAIFGLDVRVPEMCYATIARCPTLGGSLARFDSSRALQVPNVLQVLQIESGLAVVATNTWAAIQGRQALEITWKPGPNGHVASAQLKAQLVAETQRLAEKLAQDPGRTLTATYETPFLAHAPMEPMNCTASVKKKSCEVWAPTQHPQAAQRVAASISGLPLAAVTLHVMQIGGGFGRRVETDFVAEAVQVSQAVGKPVQVVWTRDDDLQHDFYRPASHHRLSTHLTSQGLPSTWTHIVATQDNDRSDHQSEPATDGTEIPYAIASTHFAGSQLPSPVPTGIWRSSNYSNAIFALESFVDEIAATSGLDPYQLRLKLLENNERLKAVTQLAASKANWGSSLPSGRGRGMAICNYFGEGVIAEVIEASLGPDHSVHVHRVVCAVDCGVVVNPDIAEAQIEGAVVFGLTAALKGEITVANGQIQQRHFFPDYPLLRIDEMPSIEVYFVANPDQPYGVGELGVPPTAPALANALFAITGRRIRHLPLRATDFS